MPTVGIRDKVRSYIGETYSVLTEQAQKPYDEGDRPDVVGGAIRETIERLFTAGTTESDITSEFVAGYVAAVATRRVIPAAINYHMERTGLSDSTGLGSGGAAGMSGLVGEQRQHYDRVQILRDTDAALAAQIQQDTDDFLVLASALLRKRTSATDTGPALSTVQTGMRTEDPYDMPPIRRDYASLCGPLVGPWP